LYTPCVLGASYAVFLLNCNYLSKNKIKTRINQTWAFSQLWKADYSKDGEYPKVGKLKFKNDNDSF
jgi:hypothetical protein